MAKLDQLGLHPATVRQVRDLEARAELAHRAGFFAWSMRGNEIDEYVRQGHSLEEVVALCRRWRLAISDVGALNDWQWSGHPPLVNRRPEIHGHTAKELWDLVERFFASCGKIGARIIVASGPAEDTGEITDAVEQFQEVCDRAARHDLRIAYEVHGMARAFSTFTQAWDLVRRADRSNGGLMLDAFHFYRGGSRLQDLSAVPVDRVFLVRLSDAPRAPRTMIQAEERLMPGEGVIPLREIVTWLDDGGYTGPYTVQVINKALDALPAEAIARQAFITGAAVLGIPTALPE